MRFFTLYHEQFRWNAYGRKGAFIPCKSLSFSETLDIFLWRGAFKGVVQHSANTAPFTDSFDAVCRSRKGAVCRDLKVGWQTCTKAIARLFLVAFNAAAESNPFPLFCKRALFPSDHWLPRSCRPAAEFYWLEFGKSPLCPKITKLLQSLMLARRVVLLTM